MKLFQVGVTANGIPVFRPKINHVTSHIQSRELIRQALSKVEQEFDEEIRARVVEFDHVIGYTNCVEVSEDDEVFFAIREQRDTPIPMVRGHKPKPCSSMVVVLKPLPKNRAFQLVTAFVGEKSEPSPWSLRLRKGSPEYRASVEFWKKHALIYEGESVKRILSEEEAGRLRREYFEDSIDDDRGKKEDPYER